MELQYQFVMKRIKSIIIYFCTLVVYGQTTPQFINLNRTDGVSNDFITCITQDEFGYMWFGSQDGLNKFDGKQIEVYKQKETTYLRTNSIKDILYHGEIGLLVLTDRSIEIFNYKNKEFENVLFNAKFFPEFLVQGGANEIWLVSSRSIFVFNTETKKIKELEIEKIISKKRLAKKRIRFYKYGRDKVVLHVGKKLFRLDPESRKLASLSSNFEVKNRTKFKIIPYRSNEFWIISLSGVDWYKKGVLFESFYKGNAKKNLNSNYILDLKPMSNNEVWLFSDGGGINIYNTEKRKFTYIESNNNNPFSLSSNFIYTSYLDRDGVLWLGHINNGISLLDKGNPFETYQLFNKKDSLQFTVPISSMFKDSDNTIWVGSDGNGIYKFKNNKIQHVYFDESIKTISSINQITKDKFLLGVFKNGVTIYNTSSHTLTKQKLLDQKLKMNAKVAFIEKDPENRFWINTGNSTIVTSPLISNEQLKLEKRMTVNGLSFYSEKNGPFLVGNFGGLYSYKDRTLQVVSGEPKMIKFILKKEGNEFWLATNKGLCLIDIVTKKTKFYGEKEGLNSENISGILRDKEKNLWVCTLKGVSKFDIETKKFFNYTHKDGFLDNIFNNPVAIKDSLGKFYFGGTKGVLAFHPDNVNKNDKSYKVIFTKLTIDKKDKFFEKPIEKATEIRIAPGEKLFTVGFSPMEFRHPNKIDFLYKLEGYDKDWIETNKNSISYMNLKPSNYTLKIKVLNTIDNTTDTKFSSIEIIVLPFWWQTAWFKVLFILFVLCFIFIINKAVLRRKQIKRDFDFEKKVLKEQKDMDEKQLRFFTNLSHEIRTPLSLIISPLQEIIKRHSVANDVETNLNLIQKSALRIERLVNMGIDYRKFEYKTPEIQGEKLDIVVFIREIVKSFRDFSKINNIELSYTTNHKILMAWFDKYMMESVMYNLLSNAFKYSYDGGKINLLVEKKGGNVIITIKDRGQGIAKEDLKNVFKEFYQSKNHKKGSGLGLALTKRIVEAHNGTIEVNSKLQEGSCFKVVFPINDLLFDKNKRLALGNESVLSSIQQVTYSENSFQRVREKDVLEVPKLKNYTLLVVEDESNLREYLVTNLSFNYFVLTASDGVEALGILANKKVDLIVSDVRMPRMSGTELCKEVRANKAFIDIKILLLTAKVLNENRKEGYESGADAYIEKPFQMDVLISRIDNLIGSQLKYKKNLMGLGDSENHNKGSVESSFYDTIIAVLEKNISNPDFKASLIIKELGISKSVLYTKLKKNSISNINELMQSLRLKRAAQLLIHTSKSPGEVATMVGFGNSKYFSTCFKKIYDTTPTNYRKENKKLENRVVQGRK